VTDFEQKVTQLQRNQLKNAENQQSCVTKDLKTVTAKEENCILS
jgi:hypothetical protein